ncbi:MAG: inositol monophosphatase family protein [Microgenomates group bacterium]
MDTINMNDILEQAARSAGTVVLSYFHKESHIRHKTTHQNIVTAADVASQELIKKIIVTELTQHGTDEAEIGFIGEENLETKGTHHTFIIDPLDGTNNFASGLDYFCISIAHAVDGVIVDSIIYWPSRDVLYFASRGKGAYKKMKGQSPIRLAVKDELLENCVIFTYLSSQPEFRQLAFRFIEKIFSVIRGIRIQGSLCLDLVHLCDTENATHITLNFHGWLWDVAAGYLIVKESGGVFADLTGNEIVVDSLNSHKQYSFLAAHPSVIRTLLPYLS